MAGRDLSRLCESVLPPEFERQKRQLPMIQAFLDENLPDAVQGRVTALSVNDEEVVIAANTPMVANYLRLHGAEIHQQLIEALQLKQAVRFRTIPDALLTQRKQKPLQAARVVSDEAVDSIKRNARCVEDSSLRDALLSLADSLAKKQDS